MQFGLRASVTSTDAAYRLPESKLPRRGLRQHPRDRLAARRHCFRCLQPPTQIRPLEMSSERFAEPLPTLAFRKSTNKFHINPTSPGGY
jgi:hypothetical protein